MVAHTGGMPSCPQHQIRITRIGEFILNRFKCSFVRILHTFIYQQHVLSPPVVQLYPQQ